MDFLSFILMIFTIYLFARIKKLENIVQKRGYNDSNLGLSAKADNQEHKVHDEIIEKDLVEERVEGKVEEDRKEVEKEEMEENGLDKFFQWLAHDWLMKLGIFLMILATGWFVSYAFLNDWIGPMGRITLGIIFGTLVLVFGEMRMKKSVDQGGAILVLGGSIILLTIFAAREIYDFFTPLSALVIMSLVIVYVASASVRFKNRSLAVLSLVMGAIAPLLTNSPDPSLFGLFSYLFALSAGTLWIVGITGWRILTPLSFLIVFFYNLTPLFGRLNNADETTGLIFAFLFSVLFYIVNLAIIIVRKEVKNSDLVVALANGFLLLLWINHAVSNELKSFVAMFVALAFSAGAFVVYKNLKLKEPMLVYSAVAVGMLAAATAFELSGPALIIAYTIEVGALVLASTLLSKDIKASQSVGLLIIVPMIMSLSSMNSYAWRKGVIHDDFFVLLILALVLLMMGVFFYIADKKSETKVVRTLTQTALVFSVIYFMALIWLSLEAGIRKNDIAHMIALIIYTIGGLVFYIRGAINDIHDLKIAGGAILTLVVTRLLLVEAWNMDLFGRIITFFVVAVLLITTAFISKKRVD
ncbi:MAG: DUF2339 domain-containing protein [Candidatus Magasanikbacteria bacterium]|nr:DUF2339 domain-containing protein [Candidatus Magasanikbacteria bacterium]